MIEIGDTVPFTVKVKTAGGVLVDAAATPVLTITLFDGTTVTPAVTRTSLGVYGASWSATIDGVHSYLWVVTDPVNGGVFGDVFVVEDSSYLPFVSLDEQLTFMAAKTVITDPAKLEELRGFIRVACTAVEDDIGRRISPQTLTVIRDGGSPLIQLPSPLISITSVVDSGTTIAPTDYVADLLAGLIYRGSATAPRWFSTGYQNVTVVARAGMRNPRPVLRKVAKNGAQRMWQGSQQMPHPSMDDLDVEEQVRAGVLTPLEYSAYLKLKVGGFA